MTLYDAALAWCAILGGVSLVLGLLGSLPAAMVYGKPYPDNPICTCGGKIGGVGECAACGSSCGCDLCMDDRSCTVEGCENSYCDDCWGKWIEDGMCVPCANALVREEIT